MALGDRAAGRGKYSISRALTQDSLEGERRLFGRLRQLGDAEGQRRVPLCRPHVGGGSGERRDAFRLSFTHAHSEHTSAGRWHQDRHLPPGLFFHHPRHWSRARSMLGVFLAGCVVAAPDGHAPGTRGCDDGRGCGGLAVANYVFCCRSSRSSARPLQYGARICSSSPLLLAGLLGVASWRSRQRLATRALCTVWLWITVSQCDEEPSRRRVRRRGLPLFYFLLVGSVFIATMGAGPHASEACATSAVTARGWICGRARRRRSAAAVRAISGLWRRPRRRSSVSGPRVAPADPATLPFAIHPGLLPGLIERLTRQRVDASRRLRVHLRCDGCRCALVVGLTAAYRHSLRVRRMPCVCCTAACCCSACCGCCPSRSRRSIRWCHSIARRWGILRDEVGKHRGERHLRGRRVTGCTATAAGPACRRGRPLTAPVASYSRRAARLDRSWRSAVNADEVSVGAQLDGVADDPEGGVGDVRAADGGEGGARGADGVADRQRHHGEASCIGSLRSSPAAVVDDPPAGRERRRVVRAEARWRPSAMPTPRPEMVRSAPTAR